MPVPSLHACLSYRNAPAAIDWQGRALGFATTMCFDDEQCFVAHHRPGEEVVAGQEW